MMSTTLRLVSLEGDRPGWEKLCLVIDCGVACERGRA